METSLPSLLFLSPTQGAQIPNRDAVMPKHSCTFASNWGGVSQAEMPRVPFKKQLKGEGQRRARQRGSRLQKLMGEREATWRLRRLENRNPLSLPPPALTTVPFL